MELSRGPNTYIEDYASQNADATHLLEEMLEVVRATERPVQDEIEHLGQVLLLLCERHDSLVDYAKAIVSETLADISRDMSATQLISAIEETRLAAEREAFERVLATLSRLISAHGVDEDYDKSLCAYREQAEELVTSLMDAQDPSICSQDEFERLYEPLRTLVEAIDATSFDDEEGKRLLAVIGDSYPWQVQTGLLLRKFRIDASIDVPLGSEGDEDAGPSEIDTIRAIGASQIPVVFEEDNPINEVGEPEEADENQSMLTEEIGEKPAEDGQIIPIEDVPDEQGEDKEAYEETETDVSEEDTWLHAVPQRIPTKVNVSEFRKELQHSAPKAVSVTFPLVCLFECIDRAVIEELCGCLSRAYDHVGVTKAITYLQKKGLVSTFVYEGHTYLCITSYGQALIKRSGVRDLQDGRKKYWVVRLRPDCPAHDEKIKLSECLMLNEKALLLYYGYEFIGSEEAKEQGFGSIRGFSCSDEGDFDIKAEYGGKVRRLKLCTDVEQGDGEDGLLLVVTLNYDNSTGKHPLVTAICEVVDISPNENDQAPFTKDQTEAVCSAEGEEDEAGSDNPREGDTGHADTSMAENAKKVLDGVSEFNEEVHAEDGGKEVLSQNDGSRETLREGDAIESESKEAEDDGSSSSESQSSVEDLQALDGGHEADTVVIDSLTAPEEKGSPIVDDADESFLDFVDTDQNEDKTTQPDVDEPIYDQIHNEIDVEDGAEIFDEKESDLIWAETDVVGGIERLLESHSVETAKVPSDEGFVALANYMLEHADEGKTKLGDYGAIVCALTLLRSASSIEGNIAAKNALEQLSLACGVKVAGERASDTLSRVFGGQWESDSPLILAAYCRALFDPKRSFDHELWETGKALLSQYSDYFPSYPEMRELLAKILEIHEVSPKSGFSVQVLDRLSNRLNRSKKLEKMKETARRLKNKPTVKAKLTGIPECIDLCFGSESDLMECMAIIEEGDSSDSNSVDFVAYTLSEYVNSSGQIDEGLIDDEIQNQWNKATAKKRTKNVRKLALHANKQLTDAFLTRLNLMDEWVSYANTGTDDESLSRLSVLRRQIIDTIVNCQASLEDKGEYSSKKVIVSFLMEDLLSRLEGVESDILPWDDFLLTGYISLTDDGMPDIDPDRNVVLYFEDWRRVIKHWIAPKPTLEDAGQSVLTDGSPSCDNLRQRRHIENLLGHSISEESLDAAFRRARMYAEREGNRFSEKLEISYAFGQIDEPQRESLSAQLATNKESIYESQEFGLWDQLIAALNQQILDMSNKQERQLLTRLEKLEIETASEEESSLLVAARQQLEDDRNFAVVEEYLNRFEAGDRILPEAASERDYFAEFISDEVYKPIFEECQKNRGRSFMVFAKTYASSHYPEDWTNRHRQSSEDLIKNWPGSRKGRYDASGNIEQLFASFGFSVKGAHSAGYISSERYIINLRKQKRNMPDYAHPIAIFGTRMRENIDVIILHGMQSAQDIINAVTRAGINGMSIVLIDGCLSLTTRRQVAEIFHTSRSKLSPFLMIDQVLALHLALQQKADRIPILLKCTLPFTYYQPFVYDGGSTDDEMFSGRDVELRTIINPKGATVVYGGRQLGKTALLQRAASLVHVEERKEFAVYADVKSCSSESAFVHKVVEEMRKKTHIPFGECETIEELCKGIDDELGKSISTLLLLCDETDNFLASISSQKYEPIKPLSELWRLTDGAFKFVFAGLHNVARYKNATDDNGEFGHLGSSLCVKPLKPVDALQLISRPLSYLGFDVKRYPHIETILTNTNYYPGILQFFGYELVEEMTKQYGHYYQASNNNPPYTLSKEQLGGIMNSRDLNDSIRDKFLLSLKLDPRYLALARCMALLTYDSEGSTSADASGFSASDTIGMGGSLGVEALSSETVPSVELLMDEMVDMGILACVDAKQRRYRLRMHRFLSILGSEDDILDAFINGDEEREGAAS